MKKLTLAVVALSLVCFSLILGCKKTETEQPAEPTQEQPAEQAPASK